MLRWGTVCLAERPNAHTGNEAVLDDATRHPCAHPNEQQRAEQRHRQPQERQRNVVARPLRARHLPAGRARGGRGRAARRGAGAGLFCFFLENDYIFSA